MKSVRLVGVNGVVSLRMPSTRSWNVSAGLLVLAERQVADSCGYFVLAENREDAMIRRNFLRWLIFAVFACVADAQVGPGQPYMLVYQVQVCRSPFIMNG